MDYIHHRTPGNRGENSFRRAVLRDELSSDHSRSRPACQGNPARNPRNLSATPGYLTHPAAFVPFRVAQSLE